MSSWLRPLRGDHDDHDEHGEAEGALPSQPERSRAKSRHRHVEHEPKDPNAPVKRLQLHQKCLYERTLPGNTFVSAHVNRLQHGYYQSKAIHEGTLKNVYFVSVHFVFHPQDHHYHRFRAATIKVSVHGNSNPASHTKRRWYKHPRSSPRILKHAPELMFGAVSPENLQWNFNLSSSLGVSQAPLSASLNPSGGIKKTYRVYDMMSIQGSLRVLKSPWGSDFDVDDAMAVWTLEENLTQRSGLPREFDFVMLVHKPDDVKKVHLSIDVDATISSWHGDYPEWYTNLSRYLPNIDYTLDMDTEVGQRFLPEKHIGKGFNFADLPRALDQYVNMPGTMYPTKDTVSNGPRRGEEEWTRYRDYEPGINNKNTTAATPDTLNVKVTLEHSSPRSSLLGGQDPERQHSIRRRRSRSELKEYGVQQAPHALARDVLKGNESTRNRGTASSRAKGTQTGVNGQA